jgi:hypothetical protein
MKGVTICSLGYAEMGGQGRVPAATSVMASSFAMTKGRGLDPSGLSGSLFLSGATNV